MNLVLFLTIGTVLITVLGELGKYPFGAIGNSVNLLDVLAGMTVVAFLVWKVAIKQDLQFFSIQKWLLVFIAIGFISLLINYNFSGVMYLIRFSIYSLFFSVAKYLVQTEKRWKVILTNTIIVSGLLAALIGFFQLLFFPNLTFLSFYGYDPHISRLAGTFLDPNFLGAFLTFSYSVALIKYIQSREKKVIIWLVVFIVAILLTFSRSAWLMFFIVNLFAIWFLPKKIIVGIVMLGLLAVVFIPRVQDRLKGAFEVDISASERLASWEKGCLIFQMNPIFGIGYNNIRSISIENNLLKPFTVDGGNSGAGVDSSWLLIFATTGILGGGFFTYWYFKIGFNFIKQFLQTRQKEFVVLIGLLIAFFINSQFINSLFYPPLMISFFLISGMYYESTQKK